MQIPDGWSWRSAARGLAIAAAAFGASLGCSMLAGIDQDYREVEPSAAGSGSGGASGSGGSSGVGGSSGGSGGGIGGSSGASGSGGATGGAGGASGTGGASGASGTGGTGGGASGCVAAGKQCVPAVAPGWVGPVVRNASSGAPPACPGSYATEVPTGLRAGLVPGLASCGCSCDPPNNQVCTGNISYTLGSCTSPLHIADLVSGAPCTPVSVPAPANLVRAGAKFSADNCAAVTAATIPTPTWGEQVRSCGAALGGETCPGGDVCVPAVPAAWTSCIYKVGAGHICPAGYTDQNVYYDAFQDTRVCSGCSCGPPTGTCGGTVRVATGAPCNSETQIALGACAPAAGVTHARYTATGPNNGACVPGSASLNGSAVPQNPVTFCCRP